MQKETGQQSQHRPSGRLGVLGLLTTEGGRSASSFQNPSPFHPTCPFFFPTASCYPMNKPMPTGWGGGPLVRGQIFLNSRGLSVQGPFSVLPGPFVTDVLDRNPVWVAPVLSGHRRAGPALSSR